MKIRTSVVETPDSALIAYAQSSRAPARVEAPAPVVSRKERSFSLGPFTLRYEEEEGVDFGALAKAAYAQLNRVRRFNFAESLQTERVRAEPLYDIVAEVDNLAAPAGQLPDDALASLIAATAAREHPTYGADGRMRQSRPYLSEPEQPNQSSAVSAATTSEVSAATFRAREALASYLAAERAGRPELRSERQVFHVI
jgi:hypothetical protein